MTSPDELKREFVGLLLKCNRYPNHIESSDIDEVAHDLVKLLENALIDARIEENALKLGGSSNYMRRKLQGRIDELTALKQEQEKS